MVPSAATIAPGAPVKQWVTMSPPWRWSRTSPVIGSASGVSSSPMCTMSGRPTRSLSVAAWPIHWTPAADVPHTLRPAMRVSWRWKAPRKSSSDAVCISGIVRRVLWEDSGSVMPPASTAMNTRMRVFASAIFVAAKSSIVAAPAPPASTMVGTAACTPIESGSATPAAPKVWQCRSTRPGHTTQPVASISSTPDGSSQSAESPGGPMRATTPSSIRRSTTSSRWSVGSIRRTLRSSTPDIEREGTGHRRIRNDRMAQRFEPRPRSPRQASSAIIAAASSGFRRSPSWIHRRTDDSSMPAIARA